MSIAIWRSTRRLSSLSPSLVSCPHQLNAPHHFHHSKLNIYNYQFQPHSFYLRAVPLTFQSASFSTNSVPPPPPSTAAGFFSRWQTISDFTPPSASSASTTSNSEEDKSQKETLDTEPKIGFSRLFQVASRERSLLTLALTAQLVSASSMLVFPLALGNVVDAVTGSSPTDLSSLITIMGVIFGLSGIATATRVSSLSLAGSNISRDLRVRLYSSILKQDTTYFDKINSNKLINRLSNDVPLVSRTLTENLSKILRSSVTTITSLGLIVYLSPKLSLITMLSIPPIGISALFFGKNAKKLSKQLTDALATATQVANERILNIKTLRLFGAEVLESKHYSRKVDETLQIAKSVAFADGIYAGSIQLAAQLSLLGVLWFGGKMVLNPLDPMTIGSLTSFSMYAVNLGVSISSIGTAYGHLSRALGSAYRIFEIIDRQPEGPSSTVSKEVEEKLKYDLRLSDRNEYINESKSTKDISDSGIILDDDYDATVKFENVKFTYPSRPDIQILKGISLTIHPGEILAVAGSSGSGKSTLSSLLSRLYEPTSGNITLNDTPVTSINTSWLRNQISVVSQEPVLFSGTIAENIAYNYDVKNRAEIEDIAKIAASHEMIMGLPNGYDTFVTNTTLSGGQRARIALCRALIRNPKILLLDEHAASLDSKSERAVAQAVTYAAKELGIAVVSIAHRSSTLRKADRVAVVVDGKVAELDSFNQLMSDEGSYLRRMLKPVAKSKLTPQSASSFSTDQAQQD